MRLHELVKAEPALKKISAQNLPTKTLYSVYRVIRELDKNLQFFYSRRADICERYAEEKDGVYVPKPEYKEQWESQMLELLNLEVEMAEIAPVKIPADENLRLSCDDLAAIEEFITIEFTEDA